MYNRLDPFFRKHKVFYKYQFGFRKNHATDNALTEAISYIYKSLDEGNYVFGIYIDLKKAFDTVQQKYSCTDFNTMEYVGSLFSSLNHTYPKENNF